MDSITPQNGVSASNASRTAAEIIAAAKALAPVFKERAVQADRDRALPLESYTALRDAGLFNILKPKKYGGLELSVHENALVTLILAEACASTAWVFNILSSDNFLIMTLPEQAQEDIWGPNNHATLGGSTFLNNKSKATRVKGGYRLTGSWSFCSGSDFCEWLWFGAVVDDGKEGYAFVVPREHTTTVDDWFPTGMRGTGSRTLQTKDLFVPEHRVIPNREVFHRPETRQLYPSFDAIQPPYPAHGNFTFSAVAVGAAYSAVKYFLETGASSTRVETLFGGQVRLAESDHVASEIAEAAGELEMAIRLIEHTSKEAAERARSRNFASAKEAAVYERDNALVTRIALRAVQKVHSVVGSKAGFPDHPVSRAKRDVEMSSHHVTLNWRKAAVDYMAAMLGVSPPGAGNPFGG